jgi:hypothetical protein
VKKMTNGLVGVVVIAAFGTAAPANAAPDCIRMDVSRVGTLCAGQPTTLGVTVENACSSPRRVALTFAMDHETLREKEAEIVEPLETLSKDVFLPLPSTLTPGIHTLTITLRDAAGHVGTTDLDLKVESCARR